VTTRARWDRLSIVVAAILGVTLLGAGTARADDPTLYVGYTMNCTFAITGDNGAPVATIPPGNYQVLVTSPQPFAEPDLSGQADPTFACGGSLSFRLTGPGVSIRTTLEDGDSAAEQFQRTFQIGTYTAEVDRRPAATRTVFTVSASAPSTRGGSTASSAAPSGTSSAKSGTKSSDPVGSALLPLRGSLSGGVSTTGKLTLKLNGKAVSSLSSGRYKVTVLDETSRAGFTLDRGTRQTIKVTGVPYVGRQSVTLTLKPGQWSFTSRAGKKTYFVVAG
jgi:hypothetical protein